MPHHAADAWAVESLASGSFFPSEEFFTAAGMASQREMFAANYLQHCQFVAVEPGASPLRPQSPR